MGKQGEGNSTQALLLGHRLRRHHAKFCHLLPWHRGVTYGFHLPSLKRPMGPSTCLLVSARHILNSASDADLGSDGSQLA